jgi:hypothetical protein
MGCKFLDARCWVQYKGGPPRSLEELKGRYYGVARALMVGRAGGEELIANEPLVKAPFDVSHEQCALGPCCLLRRAVAASRAGCAWAVYLPSTFQASSLCPDLHVVLCEGGL